MTSIRRTLLVNVLLLLVVTLGVVSVVVYRTSADALREKQRSARELVELRYEDQLDEELRTRAEILARDVQSNFQPDEFWARLTAAELFGLANGLTGPSQQINQYIHSLHRPTNWWQLSRLSSKLTLNEEDIYHDREGDAAFEFVQLSDDRGPTWMSKSLTGQAMSADTGFNRKSTDYSQKVDTLALADGRTVRRMTLLKPVMRYGRVNSPGFARPRKDDSPPASRAVVGISAAARIPPPPRNQGPFFGGPPMGDRPNFLIQCAWDTSADNPRLADKLQARNEQFAAIDAETDSGIRNLRATIGWAVVAALGGTLLGGWFLVGLGLSPLRRLSHAVSQISPRDLHLSLDPRGLPSEINPVAERLSRSLTDLEAAFAREKRAAADISHELRTPIAALITTLDVTLRKPRTADHYRETLTDCRAIAAQLGQLVERILVLAWLDAGADELRTERVEITDLVGGVAAIAKPLAEAQGLSLKVDVPDSLSVRTDPDKLREVVMNLTHNAIAYNRPGGEVELRASTHATGVAIEVRDTGIGMPPEIHEKIFERFFRGDPSRTATGVHAGLGLAIVKEYVDRLGGRLTVESTVGTGSRFRIELPNAL